MKIAKMINDILCHFIEMAGMVIFLVRAFILVLQIFAFVTAPYLFLVIIVLILYVVF